MVGRLGRDRFAVDLKENLEAVGVETASVENVAGPSGTAIILVSSNGSNSIIVIPGANASLHPLISYDTKSSFKTPRSSSPSWRFLWKR